MAHEHIFKEFEITKRALEEVLKYDPDDLVGIASLRAKLRELADKMKQKAV